MVEKLGERTFADTCLAEDHQRTVPGNGQCGGADVLPGRAAAHEAGLAQRGYGDVAGPDVAMAADRPGSVKLDDGADSTAPDDDPAEGRLHHSAGNLKLS